MWLISSFRHSDVILEILNSSGKDLLGAQTVSTVFCSSFHPGNIKTTCPEIDIIIYKSAKGKTIYRTKNVSINL